MPVRILHIHSTFSLGGKEARAVRLMNAFGAHATHTVISAVPDALGARQAIDPAIRVEFPDDHPSLTGKPAIGRYQALALYMRRFDLVLTYNWGAMDAVGARRIFGKSVGVPPLIHHEDGFNEDEASGQKPARVWFRRLMLGTAHAVVVPSHMLEGIALTSWRQSPERVRRIANGIALDRFEGRHEQARSDGVTVGTVAGLRAVKNLPKMVRAFANADIPGRLRIVGEGPEREAIESEAHQCGVASRVDLPGFKADPASALCDFDVFALSSDSEQQPISLIEAMTSGLPVVSTDVGDVREMVAEENLPFIVPPVREDLFADAMRELAVNPRLRRNIGAANRVKALQKFDERQMISEYRTLYEAAMGRPGALGS
ncbi:MAG: glycosyltransferase family 4 protein [Sphingomonadaceae bacterium]